MENILETAAIFNFLIYINVSKAASSHVIINLVFEPMK